MDQRTTIDHSERILPNFDDTQWQKVYLLYTSQRKEHKTKMESQATHRVQPIKLDTFTFMPIESTRAQRQTPSTTNRRNLRSNRNRETRPSHSQPSTPTVMSDQRRSSQGNRQFMFIDQDAARSTSNEAIRVHVMRESHRARRQLRGLMQNTESHGQMTIFSSAPSSPHPIRRAQTERVNSHSSSEQPSPKPDPETEEEEKPTQDLPQPQDKTQLKSLAQERLTAVLTTTSPAISSASQGFKFLSSLPANIIELCDDDFGALHALLALVTSVQASVSTLQAAEYESSALEILRARLAESSSADHSDETIITVLLLSRLERSRMNEETAGFHEAALMRMIRDRGGLESLESSNEALVKLLRDYGLGHDAIAAVSGTSKDAGTKTPVT